MVKLFEGSSLSDMALIEAHVYPNLASADLVKTPNGSMVVHKVFCHTKGVQRLKDMTVLLMEDWTCMCTSEIICAMLGLGRQYNPKSGEFVRH